MSLVPSNIASSNSVLPTFLATPSSRGSIENSTVGSPTAESDSPSFSDVLQQSGSQEGQITSNQDQVTVEQETASVQTVENQVVEATTNIAFREFQQGDLPTTEVAPLARQIDAPSESAEVNQLTSSTELNEQDETDVAVTVAAATVVIQQAEPVAIPVDLPASSPAIDLTDEDLELELPGRYLSESEQQSQNSEESNQNDANPTGEEVFPAADVAVESVSELAIGPNQELQAESLQELRSSLEDAFGIQTNRNREADARVFVNRPRLQPQTVGSDGSASRTVSSSIITDTSSVSGLGQADSVVAQSGLVLESNVSNDQVDLPVTSPTLADVPTANVDRNTGATVDNPSVTTLGDRQLGSPSSVQTAEATAILQENQQQISLATSGVPASSAALNVVDRTQEVANSNVVDRTQEVANSNVVNRTQEVANSNVGVNSPSEGLLSGVGQVESSDRTGLKVNRVPSDALVNQAKFDFVNRLSQAEVVPSNEGPIGVNFESITTTAFTVESSEELPPESASVVDSDLDLLQQLLPRETSSVFGASVDTSVAREEESLSLPRQIAARAIGEAEVLETGDSSRFRIRLDPPELGSVLVELQKSASGTTITVTAAEPATQQLLQDSLQQLNQSDSDEASVFENLDFDLSNGDQGESPDHDSKKSQAVKIRISGGEAAKSDSKSDSQSPTELDFVA